MADLKRRWSNADRLRLVREVRAWLTGQGSRPDGLDEHDGRTDLRGIPLFATPVTVGDKDDPSATAAWESLDLSGAQLEQLRMFAGRVSNCVFDGASLLGMRLWGTEITDSSCRRADLRSSALGNGVWQGRRNTWRRVDFSRANLRDVSFRAAILDRCTFEKTSKGLWFVDSEIHDCTFSGQLGGLVIDGRGHQYPVDPSALSADFSNATLSDFSITGYRVGKVVLPAQEDLVVVHNYPSVLRAAADWLRRPDASEDETRTAGIFDYELKAPGAEDTDQVSALNGYGNPVTTAVVGRALAAAQAIVG